MDISEGLEGTAEALDKISETLKDVGVSMSDVPDQTDPVNLVDGLFAISRSIDRLASAVQKLGVGDACTPMGAIESHSVIVRESADKLAEGMAAIAEAISEVRT